MFGNENLNALQKQNNLAVLMQLDSKGQQKMLDLDSIEYELRDSIKQIMRMITGSSADQDFQAFTTFDLTEKIESHILDLVKKMNFREKIDAQRITKLEQERRSKFNLEKLERKRALEQEQLDEERKKMDARMRRYFKREGKTSMPRSQKRALKKKEQKVVVDEDTTNMLKYVGNLQQII